MEILRVENLVKTYGKGENKINAVDNISFSIEKGEFVAIVILLWIVNLLMGDMMEGTAFVYNVPGMAILISIAISGITIFLTCLIPAIKASRIPPIEAIRGTDDIKIKARKVKRIIILVSIFLYGFIAVITLIGVTNIFNTITTNMILRSKEFANLKSIGMTTKEFNKMIKLESIMYGTKSLLIGIPIGLLGSYEIFKSFTNSIDFGYIVPWPAILISIVFVFIIVGLTMKYSLNKINKQNIIETIRQDNI